VFSVKDSYSRIVGSLDLSYVITFDELDSNVFPG
jgi:hypothetical protein